MPSLFCSGGPVNKRPMHCKAFEQRGFRHTILQQTNSRFNMWSLTVGQCSFTVVGANHTGQITTNRGRVPRRTIVAPSRCDLGPARSVSANHGQALISQPKEPKRKQAWLPTTSLCWQGLLLKHGHSGSLAHASLQLLSNYCGV